MPNSPVDSLRTLGIVAHVDAGKTTLTERILFETGARSVQGSVDDGTAATDWLPEEQRRGISIQSVAVLVRWEGHVLQVIDTPGHVDFGAEVARCFRVLDAVIVVLDGVRGVESQTISVWKQAEHWRCAKLVFVNKLDRAVADFSASVASLRHRLGARPVTISVPLYTTQGTLVGIGDVVRGFVSADAAEIAAEDLARFRQELQMARDLLVEDCAELDDELLAIVLAERPISDALLLSALRRLTIRGVVAPVAAGSALTGVGVDILLDAVGALLPSLRDRCRDGLDGWFPTVADAMPMRALVFKVEHLDQETHVYARVLEGTMEPGMRLCASKNPNTFQVGSLYLPHAGSRLECHRADAGAIVSLSAPASIRTGDTLMENAAEPDLPRCEFPSPVLSVLFEPEDSADLIAMQAALLRIEADDPTINVATDRETGLPKVSGLGELHLEIVSSRVREFTGRPVHATRPRVAFRWRLAGAAAAHASARGGPGEETRVGLHVELTVSAGDAPATANCGPGVPADCTDAVLAAANQALRENQVMGGDLVSASLCIARLEVVGPDLSESLLGAALADALALALRSAPLVRLEPRVLFTVYAPQESGSVVLADLHARGAVILEVSSGQLGARIEGEGQLSAFLGYASRLRSITRGLGEAQLEHAGYGPVAGPRASIPPRI